MAQKKQDQEAQEAGVKGMKWGQKYQLLGDAIERAKKDALDMDLSPSDEKQVKQHLRQASQHHAAAANDSGKEEEHIKAGFDYVGKVSWIISNSPVSSYDDRRYKWPFIPPGMD